MTLTQRKFVMLNSNFFGRTFRLDKHNWLESTPTFITGEPDNDQWDYVSEWTDWEGVDYNKLFAIYSKLITLKYESISGNYKECIDEFVTRLTGIE